MRTVDKLVFKLHMSRQWQMILQSRLWSASKVPEDAIEIFLHPCKEKQMKVATQKKEGQYQNFAFRGLRWHFYSGCGET